MSAEPIAAALVVLVRPRVQAPVADWFAAAAGTAASGPKEAFFTAFAAAGRRLGKAPVTLATSEASSLRSAGMEPLPGGWGLDECGRGALILRALGPLASAERTALASELFYRGDVRERQALLRVLGYLPSPADFRDLAIEACRTSVQSLFEAIACENPYPAAHFPDSSFNQMVLKALFTGVTVDLIADLDRRVTSDLVRMAEDYAAERRAAGRPVPADVDRIVSIGARRA